MQNQLFKLFYRAMQVVALGMSVTAFTANVHASALPQDFSIPTVVECLVSDWEETETLAYRFDDENHQESQKQPVCIQYLPAVQFYSSRELTYEQAAASACYRIENIPILTDQLKIPNPLAIF